MCCACGGGILPKPVLKLTTTTEFHRIFDDRDTGSRVDGALWQPTTNYPWFSTVASNQYGSSEFRGTQKGVYATDNSGNMLKPPARWEKIWDDRGSGAPDDRSLWRAVPEPGYTCLGHVGKGRRGEHFSNGASVRNSDFPNYRCVLSEYVRQIPQSALVQVWNDAGSGARDDASIWQYRSPNGYALAFGNKSHGKPSGPFYDFEHGFFD
jgi:hypothetical protein